MIEPRADDHAVALARWDDEGGAAKPSPGTVGEEWTLTDNAFQPKASPRPAWQRKVKPAA
jgi:hypothetical protein